MSAGCPGCGYQGSTDPTLPDPPGNVSRECWWCYAELSAYNAERGHKDFMHQHAVDAYAAQHPGRPSTPITVWFALVGLHLAIDRGMTGHAVQRAHMRLAEKTVAWSTIQPPADLTGMSAADVMTHPAGEERDRAIVTWAGVVWSRWAPVHDQITDVCAAYELA